MSSAHRSLNSRVRIESLLRLLGCHARGQGLPLRTRCPICRKGQLTVFRDLQCGGGWHACNSCGSNGDLLALAARTRNTSIPNVIAQLVGEGLYIPSDTAAVQQYLTEHVEYDARLQQLWTTAQEAHARPHVEFVQLTQQLGLQREAWRNNGRESIGRLIGSLHKSEVEKCFAPAVMADATARHQTGSPSAHRVFPGKHWERVVAIPYMDLPGRIASFLFVGRQADPERDYVVKRAHRGPQGNQFMQADAEAGVAYAPDVYDAADAFNRTVIGLGDPLLTLRLQLRHLRDHQRSLPLANWYDTDAWPHWNTGGRRTRTQRAWQQFSGYHIALWAPLGLDVLVLRQAIAADAWISTAGPQFRTDEQLKEYIWKRPPDQLCRQIIDTARPWNEVLSKELEKSGSSELRQWAVQLEAECESVETVVSRLQPRIRERMQEAMATAQSPRTIELDGQTILEANGHWQLLRNGRPPTLILNAIFRIDRALYDKERERGHVRGRILVNDHVISFSEPLSLVEEDTAGFLTRTVSQMGIGFLQYDQRYASKLIRIATAFQEPQKLDAVSRVGWDADSVRMVFPKFAIRFGGEVQDVSDTLIPDFAPALELQPPTELGLLPQDLDPARENAKWGDCFGRHWRVLPATCSLQPFT